MNISLNFNISVLRKAALKGCLIKLSYQKSSLKRYHLQESFTLHLVPPHYSTPLWGSKLFLVYSLKWNVTPVTLALQFQLDNKMNKGILNQKFSQCSEENSTLTKALSDHVPLILPVLSSIYQDSIHFWKMDAVSIKEKGHLSKTARNVSSKAIRND